MNKYLDKVIKTYPKILLAGIILFFLVLLPLFYFAGPMSMLPSEDENFIIGLNDTQKDVIDKLNEQGLLKNKDVFEFILKEVEINNPGGYFLSKSMWPIDIIETLTSPSNQIWVTFEEGTRKEQYAKIIQSKLNWDDKETQEFISSAREGYLFPNTYLLNTNSKPKDIVEKLENQLQKEIEDLEIENLHEVITFASIIERESLPTDCRLVAGILQNRLDKGIPLQVDATVQYTLGTQKAWWPRIYISDYKTDHPYNTYKIKGLPPGAICNPGIRAIKAALAPEKTGYMYYLHDKGMLIHPAYTYQQHLTNFYLYLK